MSEAVTTPTPQVPEASPAAHLVDFSDKLSPMLVKELRQGMRTNLFTVAFILLQAFMILCMLFGMNGGGSETSGFFWFFVIAAMLVVQPIRGFGALSSEYSLNTMDLIQLTRLGAWRIAFGKWAAIVAQSMLLLTGILPYVVMRYFQGGIDLFKDLEGILYVMLGTCLLTAVTVGFSSFKSVILRVALLIGAGIGAMIVGVLVIETKFNRYTGVGSGIQFWETVGAVIAVIYATYYLLDLGAGRIAPESANHSSRKRIISLIFIVVMLLLPFIGVNSEFVIALTAIVILLVGIDSITESPSVLPGVLRPFSKLFLTRMAAGFLTPGWHTGLRYFVLCSVLLIVGIFVHIDTSNFDDMESWIMTVSAIAAVTFPLLIIHLFFYPVTYSQFYFGLYVLIQVCVFAVAFFVSIVASELFGRSLNPLLYMCFPIPFVNIFSVTWGNNEEPYFLIASLVFLFFSLLVPAIRSGPIFKRMRETFVGIRDGNVEDIIEQTERQIIPESTK